MILLRNFLLVLATKAIVRSNTTAKKLEVVSAYSCKSSNKFFFRVRQTKPQINEPNIGLETKKQICRDIFASNYEVILDGYNPSELVDVFDSCTGRTVQEYAFPCRVVNCSWIRPRKIGIHYISEEYNFSDLPDAYIAGRFIFWLNEGRIYLIKQAEEAAKTVSCLDYNVELHYQAARENYTLAVSPAEDALCKLGKNEKSRICTSVFNSEYFKDQAKARAISGGRRYEEWMMRCATKKNGKKFDYFLSQAHKSNEIFVYLRDSDRREIYVENLSTRVRLPWKH